MKINTKSVMIFGSFDFLHLGHCFLIESAAKYGKLTIVVARDSTIFKVKGKSPRKNCETRVKFIKKIYPEHSVVMGHEKDKSVPLRKFSPGIVCLGYDQSAFADVLEKYKKDSAPKLKMIRLKPFSPLKHKSSKFSEQAQILRGNVVKGLGIGRKLGYRTANLDLKNAGLKLESGVFAGHAFLRGRLYKTATVIGIRKVGKKPLVEAHILDFQGSCYGENITLALLEKIRDIEMFANNADLVKAIKKDIEYVYRNH